MNKQNKKGGKSKHEKHFIEVLLQKELTALEISKLSPRLQSYYYTQIVLKNLNDSLAQDNSN